MPRNTQGGFIGAAGGNWAGTQLAQAISSGQELSPMLLRTQATLRRDEWDFLLDELTRVGRDRLTAVADLAGAGLTRDVPNAMGRSTISIEKVDDGGEAIRSMSPIVRGDFEQPDYLEDVYPNYFTHSDFFIDMRKLSASRERGESVDTTSLEVAGRRVAESLEDSLFLGAPEVVVNGAQTYGYITHPARTTRGFGTGGNWAAGGAKTGAQILSDVLAMMGDLKLEKFYGPYWLYVPTNTELKLEEDFKAESDQTIRDRLLRLENLAGIRTADRLTDNNIVLLQPTRDVVQWADGEGIQPVQWDIMGGLAVNFKVMAIQIPLIKSNYNVKTGIVHMS